jgi:putative endonuclease
MAPSVYRARRDQSDERRAAEERGRRAEAVAAWYLRAKGYRVLARRYRTPVGEIDLVVARGRVIAFVEVKARPSLAEGAEAVTATGRRRIARAAALWLAAHPDAARRDLRFDVIVAAPGRLPRHITGAFDAAGGA